MNKIIHTAPDKIINRVESDSLEVALNFDEVISALCKEDEFFSFEYKLPEFSDSLVSILEKINKIDTIKINFSVGHSRKLHLRSWMDFPIFMQAIKNNDSFLASMGKYGEIHVAYSSLSARQEIIP